MEGVNPARLSAVLPGSIPSISKKVFAIILILPKNIIVAFILNTDLLYLPQLRPTMNTSCHQRGGVGRSLLTPKFFS